MAHRPIGAGGVFQRELGNCGRGRTLTYAQVLATSFSDAPADNGFLLMSRYERGLHNQLHRLLSRYDQLKKLRPTMPIDETEAARGGVPTRIAAAAASATPAAAAAAPQLESPDANRTQSKPTENPPGGAESPESVVSAPAPATRQSHDDPDAAASPPAPVTPAPNRPGM